MNNKLEVLKKVNQVAAKAEELYSLDMSELEVRFDLKGKCAAMACWRGSSYFLRFNVEAMELDMDEMINDTVAHEVAHTVCQMNPTLGNGHNAGWKRVAQSLGSTGKRTHSLKLTPARKMNRYVYIASCGTEITLSAVSHNKVQKGQDRRLKRTHGKIQAKHYVGPAL